jgi:hypothetical protein
MNKTNTVLGSDESSSRRVILAGTRAALLQ